MRNTITDPELMASVSLLQDEDIIGAEGSQAPD